MKSRMHRSELRHRAKAISCREAERALRAYALNFAEAAEWGERFIRVRGRIFVSLDTAGGGLRLGVKLPISGPMALTLPFCQPAGRALGPAGWVTARFDDHDEPPLALLKGWIDQSYRAIAPRTLVKALGGARQPLSKGQHKREDSTMTKFMVLYMAPMTATEQRAKVTAAQAKAEMDDWMKWAKKNEKAILDNGTPFGKAMKVTASGASDDKSQVTGYSIVQGDTPAAVSKIFAAHPHLKMKGASIEVMECMQMPGM
jgi:hypothetical protein